MVLGVSSKTIKRHIKEMDYVSDAMDEYVRGKKGIEAADRADTKISDMDK